MRSFLFISLLFFIACANPSSESEEEKTDGQEENGQTPETDLDQALVGLWQLEKLEGEDFVMEEGNGLGKTPQISIIAENSRFQGNDGCNNLAGAITNSEKGSIEFSKIAATKMACENMDIPDRFANALTNTKKYKLEAGNLFLHDENDKELLSLSKVE